MSASVLSEALCPQCATTLGPEGDGFRCEGCGQVYPALDGIAVLLPQPESWLALWRAELALVERQGREQLSAVEAQIRAGDVLESTRDRCRAMVKGARDQVSEIAAVLSPLLPEHGDMRELPNQRKSPLERVHYLFRDWGWDAGAHAENERAAAMVADVAEGKPLGTTLVLGAGACRLAYDVHQRLGASETVVLDLDPLLFVFAHKIVRGAKIHLTEATISVHETDCASRVWELAAPQGPLDDEAFHFVFADGLQPPFAPESF
ncbi:MAG TPA: hypothetical protein VJT73_21435, partial [Polyangiaceae bacterium]|nr:hypothetical protein [Polyangiaceae bacterium]